MLEHPKTKLAQTFRFKEWWNSKVPMLLGVYVVYNLPELVKASPFVLINEIAVLLWWILSAASFGYLMNNIFDAEQDAKANKPNSTTSLNKTEKIAWLVLLGMLAVFPWIVFAHSFDFTVFAVFQLLLFCLYSIPPFRFKEEGYLGIVTDAVYAFVLPVTISCLIGLSKSQEPFLAFYYLFSCIFYVFTGLNNPIFHLLIWSLCAGMRSILLHQFKDRKSDALSGCRNVVNSYGVKANAVIINTFLLPLELISFTLLLFELAWLPQLQIGVFVLYLIAMGFSISRHGVRWSFMRRFRSLRVSPSGFYDGLWLFLNLLILVYYNPNYWFLPILQLIFFQDELFNFVGRFWHFLLQVYYFFVKGFYAIKRIVKPLFVNFWHHLLRPIVSAVINYTLYYFRRIILRQTDAEARLPLTIWEKYFGKPNQNLNSESESNQTVYSAQPLPDKNAEEVYANNSELSVDNKVVNGLWIGDRLSNIELLTIHSFVSQGHTFRLWVYEHVQNIPTGTEVCDANEIIPAEKIFRYKNANAYGHGKGSVSGFSDVFRYKLLYEKGGWWVDMDVCCIRPFNFNSPYFFRKHHELPLVGNMMKCPAGSELMKNCYEEALQNVDENNTDWHKPIEILNREVFKQGLEPYIFTAFSNQDKWEEIKRFIKKQSPLPPNYVALHWMNEEWRTRGMHKNDIRFRSTLGQLMYSFSLIPAPTSKVDLWKNDFHHLLWLPIYDVFVQPLKQEGVST